MIKNENMIMSSVGLYSSWCFRKNYRTMFDCGDGCAQILKQYIFGVENIFFSHCHVDHVAGLFSFIGLRNKTMGDNKKPINIFYPQKEYLFKNYQRFADELFPDKYRKFNINWAPINEGDIIPIKNKVYVKAFKTFHNANSLGYVICEESKKLKPGYDPKTIGDMIKNGIVSKDDVMERKDIKHFAYTLDNCGFDTKEVMDVKEIVLDATFLDIKDRDAKSHATLDEAKEIAKEINCKTAYFAHISPRYDDYREIICDF